MEAPSVPVNTNNTHNNVFENMFMIDLLTSMWFLTITREG